ncbi:MAG: hypothetical protein AAFU38_20145, partial [Bacteroidota bacterium]
RARAAEVGYCRYRPSAVRLKCQRYLARVLLYTLKGSLIAEHGREMVSHGLGYYSKAARAARAAWAHEQYGHTWNPDEIWMPGREPESNATISELSHEVQHVPKGEDGAKDEDREKDKDEHSDYCKVLIEAYQERLEEEGVLDDQQLARRIPCISQDDFEKRVEKHRRNCLLVTGRTRYPGYAYQREYISAEKSVVVYPCRVIETDSGEALVRLGATTSKRQALRFIKRKRARLAQRRSHAQQAEQTPQPGGGDE